jgi:hypothetical protein
VTYQEHNYRATVGRDYDQQRRERTRRVAHTDESDQEALLEENLEVLGAQRIQRPTYLSMEQLDKRLKHIEIELQKSQEKERAQRDQIFKEVDTRCYLCGQIDWAFQKRVHANLEILKRSRLNRSYSQ